MSGLKHNTLWTTQFKIWPQVAARAATTFQFTIAEALQPHQCYGRPERQALQQQDRCEQVGFEMTVDIDGKDRGGAGGQQRAEQHFGHRHDPRGVACPAAASDRRSFGSPEARL